ncbi:hypothetical protein V8C42DRAFT_40100 [Trichoderma barbatum]
MGCGMRDGGLSLRLPLHAPREGFTSPSSARCISSGCPSCWPGRAAPRPPSPSPHLIHSSLPLLLLLNLTPPCLPIFHPTPRPTMNMDRRADDATASASTHEPSDEVPSTLTGALTGPLFQSMVSDTLLCSGSQCRHLVRTICCAQNLPAHSQQSPLACQFRQILIPMLPTHTLFSPLHKLPRVMPHALCKGKLAGRGQRDPCPILLSLSLAIYFTSLEQ